MIHSRVPHSSTSSREHEYLAGWQRARAELANVRKRAAAEYQQQEKRAARRVINDLLSMADNFLSVVQHTPPELQDNAWAQGVVHVARQFEQILTDQGVTTINPMHQPFDPNWHEAVDSVVDEKQASGTVVLVLQPGYALAGEVLRPAKVKIVK